jgi:hypothetical protein
VLVVTALFFALWTVALKKTLTGSGSHAAAGPSAPALQSAVNSARGLQSVVNSASAKAGGTPTPTAPSSTPPSTPPSTARTAPPTGAHSAPPATTTPSATAGASAHRPAHAHGAAAAASSSKSSAGTAPVISLPHSRPTPLAVMTRALKEHKVLALLVYNPAAPDDRAVNTELKSIPTLSGRVVKLAVPVQDLGGFSSLLNEVPVNFSPTLVLIDKHRQADEIAGFADTFEIAQRVDAALGFIPTKH